MNLNPRRIFCYKEESFKFSTFQSSAAPNDHAGTEMFSDLWSSKFHKNIILQLFPLLHHPEYMSMFEHGSHPKDKLISFPHIRALNYAFFAAINENLISNHLAFIARTSIKERKKIRFHEFVLTDVEHLLNGDVEYK